MRDAPASAAWLGRRSNRKPLAAAPRRPRPRGHGGAISRPRAEPRRRRQSTARRAGRGRGTAPCRPSAPRVPPASACGTCGTSSRLDGWCRPALPLQPPPSDPLRSAPRARLWPAIFNRHGNRQWPAMAAGPGSGLAAPKSNRLGCLGSREVHSIRDVADPKRRSQAATPVVPAWRFEPGRHRTPHSPPICRECGYSVSQGQAPHYNHSRQAHSAAAGAVRRITAQRGCLPAQGWPGGATDHHTAQVACSARLPQHSGPGPTSSGSGQGRGLST